MVTLRNKFWNWWKFLEAQEWAFSPVPPMEGVVNMQVLWKRKQGEMYPQGSGSDLEKPPLENKPQADVKWTPQNWMLWRQWHSKNTRWWWGTVKTHKHFFNPHGFGLLKYFTLLFFKEDFKASGKRANCLRSRHGKFVCKCHSDVCQG